MEVSVRMDPRMQQEPLLASFPALRTRDLDEVKAWLGRAYAVRRLDIPLKDDAFECVVNHRALPSIALTYASYGSELKARLEQTDFYVQGFPLTGFGEVCWNGKVHSVSLTSGGIVGAPGSSASLNYSNDFSHLVLRITPSALTRRLALLLDRPVDPPLQFTGQHHPDRLAAFRRLLRFLADELDRTETPLSDLVLSELEDSILCQYLLTNEHNYSWLIDRAPSAAAPWQVRRAVDYIEQHWDEPITIEQLTRISETGARNLFLMFKKTYDVSPMVYLSQVRLRHARRMLSQPSSDTSVAKVGFMCGFSNMGMFAMKYHGAFGERPSETLRGGRKY